MKTYLAVFALVALGVIGFAFTKKSSVDKINKQEMTTAESNKVKQMNNEMFKNTILDYTTATGWANKSGKPVVIDLYADWCGPCRMIAPILKDLANEYDGKVDFYKVDVDKEKDLASLFQARSIPLVVLITKSGEVKPMVGAQGKSSYKKAIDSFLLGIK